MESNAHLVRGWARTGPVDPADGLAMLAAAVDALAAQDPDRLPDAALAEQVLALRTLADRLDGQWLRTLAAADARGAAGAEDGVEAGSTAAWLRRRSRLGAEAAASSVRTARALFRGPLAETAQALTRGELSAAHAAVLAHGVHHLPDQLTVEAEPVLVEAARRLDPPRLRRVVGHLLAVADPEGAGREAERRHQRRGLWLASTLDGMVAVDGLVEPEAGHTLLAALESLARPADAHDERSGPQRRADALVELARRALGGGTLPHTGGVRPQLTVVVDIDTLLSHCGAVGGEVGGPGPLDPEACRRLACDSAVTRVLVTHHPNHHPSSQQDPNQHHLHNPHGPCAEHPTAAHDPPGPEGRDSNRPMGWDPNEPIPHTPNEPVGLAGRLQAAMALLPPNLGGAPTQPLEVGRASRVVQPAQRTALAVRDGGCVFPGCTRPLAWCEAHHLRHWLHGGPTDLANLALLCRAHHRAVHEGGWRLQRQLDGHLTATPPQRPHRANRQPPSAA